MKKLNLKRGIFAALLLALIAAATLVVTPLFGGTTSASAYDYSDQGSYSFYYENFDITFDVSANRKLSVREELTVKFTGYKSTGFMRDIPVNGGELVKNVKVTELLNGEEVSVPYNVESYQDDNSTNYITADIGSSSIKTGETHTYILTYDYCLTKAQEGANELAVNAIGPQDRRVEKASATFILPKGLIKATYVLGVTGTADSSDVKDIAQSGDKIVAKLQDFSLEHNMGITFNFVYEEGVLSTYFDFSPYIPVIALGVLLICMLAVKFLCFNNRKLTPVVNFEAPENMDPLIMGKLIDNKIDPEDVSSMIFYWADKGYLKICLDDVSNPELIRLVRELPETCPDYEKQLFYSLFGNDDYVFPKLLSSKFHTKVTGIMASVNKRTKDFYEKKSVNASIVFTVLGGFIMAFAPLLLVLFEVSMKFKFFDLLIAAITVVPLVLVYGFGRAVVDRSAKQKGKLDYKILATIFACMLVGLAVGVFYGVLLPAGTIGFLPKLLIVLLAYAKGVCSPLLHTRTKEHNERHGKIVGFKQFIMLAEKDRLEKMINDNPQFYYHVLPYAQVLGVSDVWQDKFESIALPPPSYVTYSHSTMHRVLEFHMINSAFKNITRTVSNKIVPPSSSGGSGRGGFSGGHSGGGHGGGGSRGR